MKAVDWKQWILDPTRKQQLINTTNDHLLWEDNVTGTRFAISEKEYDRLIGLLDDKLKASNLEVAEKIFIEEQMPFSIKEDLKVAPHLPYPKPVKSKSFKENRSNRTRLVDHVLVRVGLYYAIYQPDPTEWEEKKLNLLQLDTPLANEIDTYLLTNQWPGGNVEVDVVKAGAVKIKQYFLETNNIQEVRGASVLLDEINGIRVPELCKEYWTKESLIYSGGGNMLLVLPKGEGQRCCDLIDEMFRKITITAQSVSHFETFELNSLGRDSFSNTLGWLELRKSEKQFTMLPPLEENVRVLRDINAYRPEKMEVAVSGEAIRLTGGETDLENITAAAKPICSLCNQRLAKQRIKYKGDKKAVCHTCLHKVIAGRNKKIHLDEFSANLKNIDATIKINKLPDNLKDLVEGMANNFIACVYGDGNNMGQVVENISSFTGYRYFSQLTDAITKYSLYNALYEVMGDKIVSPEGYARFEILAVGGDDVFFLVPGEFSLPVTRKLGENFDRAFSKITEVEQETITISAGVCIGNYQLPFIKLAQTASELMDSAKKYKKEIFSKDFKGIQGGTIDYMKLQTSTPYAGGLDEFRKMYLEEVHRTGEKETKYQRYFRPLLWKQMEGIESMIQELKRDVSTSRALVYKFKEVSETMTKMEGNLFFLYHMSSGKAGSKQQEQRDLFQRIVRKQTGEMILKDTDIKLNDLYFEKTNGNTTYSPWNDLVELWDVKG